MVVVDRINLRLSLYTEWLHRVEFVLYIWVYIQRFRETDENDETEHRPILPILRDH